MSQIYEMPTHRIGRYRHEESENHLARGLECLLLSEEGAYQDKALLTEACDAFIESIKFNRQNTEAYVGMAYLLWLLGDAKQALTYLEQGLRTNPSNPDVHTLIKKISGTSVQSSQAQTSPKAINNQVLSLVQGLLKRIGSEKSGSIQGSVNPHVIEHLQEKLVDWETAYDEVLTAIDGLEAFHDRVILTCDLGPVQDRIIAYNNALKTSEKMLQLDDKIQENTQLVRQYLAELDRDEPGMFQAYLDVLLDNCDTLADELDVFEQEGLNIGSLDSHYQQLADRVEELQTRLEGI